MTSHKSKHINPLKSLVDNGTITQSQADKAGFCSPVGHGIYNSIGKVTLNIAPFPKELDALIFPL